MNLKPLYLIFTIILLSLISCKHNIEAIPQSVYKKELKNKKDRPDLAIEQEFLMVHDPKLNRTAEERLLPIRSDLKKGKYKSSLRNNETIWEERGPNNVGGRTRAALVDLNDPSGNTVWAGGVSGGLWKSENFQSDNVTWSVIDDFLPSIAISYLVQDPSNPDLLYFGTGEGWFNNDAVRGLGIWKSTDGGSSWNQLPSTNNSDFHYTQRIKIDNNGNIYTSTRNAGIQKSTNGGNSWAKLIGGGIGGSFSDRAADLEIASNGDIYVSFGLFSSDGIYKSSDEGVTWTSLNDPSKNNGLPKENYNRIEIAVAPSDPLVVYAVFEDADNSSCSGIYRTIDGGENWQSMTVPSAFGSDNFARDQAWYDLTAAVDPVNPYIVYIGGIDLHRSMDGGETWTQISQWYGGGGFQYVHADQHDIIFFPNNRYLGFAINDGGITKFKIDSELQNENISEYCTPLHTNCCNDYITNVKLNQIDNNSKEGEHETIDGYTDFTAISTELMADKSYDLKITSNVSWDGSKVGAWIDYNQNGEFEESENIISESGKGPYSANFSVPNSAGHGKTRLRIRLQFSPDYIPHPCDGAFTLGESEDYSVFIENCITGNVCNDEDPCTENDILNSNCECVGSLIDIDKNGECDLINFPVFEAAVSNYNVTQFYSCAIHPDANSNLMLAGTQDNGTQYFKSAGMNSTVEVTGGDGGFCFIDQNEPNIQISTYIYNNFRITKNFWVGSEDRFEIGDSKGRFITPMDYDSENNALYAVYDDGFISRIRDVGGQNNYDTIAIAGMEDVKASVIKVDPTDPTTIWIGTPKESQIFGNNYVSKLFKVMNANSDNPLVEKTVLIDNDQFFGYGYMSSLDISKDNPDFMILTFSNYGIPSIWLSKNGGDSWENLQGNLPDMPVRWIMFDPFGDDRAIIATEMGVWKSSLLDGQNTVWEAMNEGLANVKCTMLKYRTSDNTLLVATYGRGLFTTTYCSSKVNYAEIICKGSEFAFFEEIYTDEGTYSIDVADETSCSGFTSHILNLVVEDTVSLEVNESICFGETIVFEGIEYSTTGIYPVFKAAENTCGFIKINFNLIVNNLTTVELGDTIYLDISEDYVIQADKVFTSYLWSNGSTNSTLEVSGQALGEGTHNFDVEVLDELGCSANDGIVIVVQNSSSTVDVDSIKFDVYPNPASTLLFVKLEYNEAEKINIFNLQGKLISSDIMLQENLSEVNVQDLLPGLYFVVLNSGNKVYKKKFIKL